MDSIPIPLDADHLLTRERLATGSKGARQRAAEETEERHLAQDVASSWKSIVSGGAR